jgi:hypothetical protein
MAATAAARAPRPGHGAGQHGGDPRRRAGRGAIGAPPRPPYGFPAEAPSPAPGAGPDLDPAACAGRYERYWVAHDIALDGDGGLVATTTFDPALHDLFPSYGPVALAPVGGGG